MQQKMSVNDALSNIHGAMRQLKLTYDEHAFLHSCFARVAEECEKAAKLETEAQEALKKNVAGRPLQEVKG